MIYWNVTGAIGDEVGQKIFSEKVSAPYSAVFIFNESYFGLCPQVGRNESPQIIDLVAHKEKIARDLNLPTAPNSVAVPEQFDGILVLDLETWSPWYRLTPEPMKQIARNLIRKKYPIALPNWLVERGAESQFNRAAIAFFTATIEAIRKARPRAQIGFYGFPFTWNYPNHAEYGIPFNDFMRPIYEQLDVLLPSIYMLYPTGYTEGNWTCTEADQKYLVDNNLNEARRVRDTLRMDHEIIPYCWYRYHDVTGIPQAGQLMSAEDLSFHLKYPLEAGDIKHCVLWGWENVGLEAEKFRDYAETIKSVV